MIAASLIKATLANPGRVRLASAIAGLCFGVATTFKQTHGAFAFISMALFLLTVRFDGVAAVGSRADAWRVVARATRSAVLVGALLLFGYFVSADNTSPASCCRSDRRVACKFG